MLPSSGRYLLLHVIDYQHSSCCYWFSCYIQERQGAAVPLISLHNESAHACSAPAASFSRHRSVLPPDVAVYH